MLKRGTLSMVSSFIPEKRCQERISVACACPPFLGHQQEGRAVCAGTPFQNRFKTTDDRLGELDTIYNRFLTIVNITKTLKRKGKQSEKKERSRADTIQVDNGEQICTCRHFQPSSIFLTS
jgi:hypothetical protein